MARVPVRPSAPIGRGAFWSTALAAALLCSVAGIAAGGGAAVAAGHGNPHRQHESSFLGQFSSFNTIGSATPSNGDQNPYGIVVVPRSIGKLVAGETLISNFNDMANAQGTGTTIVELDAKGNLTVFATIDASTLPGACPGGVGLTTALAVLPRGYVVVGSVPTNATNPSIPLQGCLIVLNSQGTPVETWSGGAINGPWDLTAKTTGSFTELFVSNVLNGTVAAAPNAATMGTVVRLDVVTPAAHQPRLKRETVVGSGFSEQLNGGALVIGPTGLALGDKDVLYVADTLNNRIVAIPRASSRRTSDGTGTTVSANGALNGPLGLTLAPNGNVIAVNSGDGNAVEIEPDGDQIATATFDTATGAGALFGLTIAPNNAGVLYVDDGDNTLKIWG